MELIFFIQDSGGGGGGGGAYIRGAYNRMYFWFAGRSGPILGQGLLSASLR